MAVRAEIVVDTSFCTRGKFQAGRLAKIFERMVSRGHTVIVPEVVVWEWAEHLHQTLDAGDRMAKIVAGEARAAGLVADGNIVRERSPQGLCDHIANQLVSMPGVMVERTIGEDAVGAIRDQVLQERLGIRKGSTKTGAADSLVLAAARRSIARQIDDGVVVLCTSDDELGALAAQIDDSLTVVKDHRELWRWHGTTQPLDDDLAGAIRRWLIETHETAVDGPLQQLSVDPMTIGRIDHHGLRVAADLETRSDHYKLDLELRRFSQVWVSDVEVVDGEELPNLVLATVTAMGEVSVDDWFFAEGGDLLHDHGSASAQITTSVLASFDEQWSVSEVDVEEVAHVRPLDDDDPRWSDESGEVRTAG